MINALLASSLLHTSPVITPNTPESVCCVRLKQRAAAGCLGCLRLMFTLCLLWFSPSADHLAFLLVYVSLISEKQSNRQMEIPPPLAHSCSISTRALFFPGGSSECLLCLISLLINGLPPNFPYSTPPFSKHTHIHSCLFFHSSLTVPVHDGPRCTSTSLLCFLWKAVVRLSPPSCSHQCFSLREFPISPTGTNGFTRRAIETLTNQGVHFPESPASPQPSGSDIIPQSLRELFLRAPAF